MFEASVESEAQAVAQWRAAVDAALAAAETARAADAAAGYAPESATPVGTGVRVDRIGALERAARAICAAQLVAIAGLDSAQRCADRSARVGSRLAGRTVGTEVGLTVGVSTSAGSGRVIFARSLLCDYPALLRLLADGLISEWHLRLLVAATEHLTPEQKTMLARQLAVDIRARHSRGVKELTPHQVGEAATRLAIGIDPDAATERFHKARRHREVAVINRRDGAAALWAKGPAELTQHMYDELERDALTRRHDGDPRSVNAIMFEQLYETVTGYRPTGPDPIPEPTDADSPPAEDGPVAATEEPSAGTDGPGTASDNATSTGNRARAGAGGPAARSTAERAAGPDLDPGDLPVDDPAHDTYTDPEAVPVPGVRALQRRQRKVEVQVVMSWATLLGLNEDPALLRGYGAIPAEIARRIGDTSTDDHPSKIRLRRLFCDPADGRLLSMDTDTRLFKGPLRQFAMFRDHTCRLSGGRIRDIDHITPAHRGGPTSAANGQALAKNPHVLRDHPGVHVRIRPYRPGRDGPPDGGDGPPDEGHGPQRPPGPSGPAGGSPPGGDPGGSPDAPRDGPRDGPSGRDSHELLDDLRANAPNVEWTLPSGHTHLCEPPPALGHGSTAPPPTSVMELEFTLAIQRVQTHG
jgi:hypothetical protein